MSSCEYSGDIAWVLTATGLVLSMTPGLAFFEAGLLRSKSTVSVMMQVFSGLVLLSCLWFLIGYSLTFSETSEGFIGDLNHFFFLGVSFTDCSPLHPKIPEAAFALFQMMFAVITPLLMTGAFAERMKFSAFVVFILCWEIIVYFPVAHWIWGGGFLQSWGVLDFAGGITIHTTAGVGALVASVVVGKRADFRRHNGETPTSNLPLAAIGMSLLWVGWYGFNGGSALLGNSIAVSAVSSTHFAAVFSGLIWFILAWYRGGKPSLVATLNGCLAGLAGVTPSSGYINLSSTVLLAVLLGVASYYSCILVKHKLHIDDALDVSSVHGLTGVIGSIFIGLFSEQSVDPVGGADGAAFGNPSLLGKQLAAVSLTIVYTAIMTFAILKIVEYSLGGLRGTLEMERKGMDGEFAEKAYLMGKRQYVESDGDGSDLEDGGEKECQQHIQGGRKESHEEESPSSNNGIPMKTNGDEMKQPLV